MELFFFIQTSLSNLVKEENESINLLDNLAFRMIKFGGPQENLPNSWNSFYFYLIVQNYVNIALNYIILNFVFVINFLNQENLGTKKVLSIKKC